MNSNSNIPMLTLIGSWLMLLEMTECTKALVIIWLLLGMTKVYVIYY